jgi:hypothetical protein
VVFAAEKEVYAGTNWKAVRDQIIREPGDDKKHWVEQTVVLFPSGEQAVGFFGESRDDWKNCANTSVSTEGSDYTSYDWKIGEVSELSDSEITIDMEQQDSDNWPVSTRWDRCPTSSSKASCVAMASATRPKKSSRES